ncbi:hypothetical protein AL755_05270 [Arthrobacter sp. ERGS1:01]|uniref:hypothetical protein n=1 Tax=Arthrobacter sp. ERGS1:01 TaxID=1704044 RepID=UPI0006B4E131|nr:hypothetical protein [Arthrobacter sp. ERGS1:01]ALE05032.1 hypothetical protein AL755_05270 [Arthrobacter sp. ERGS1:01]
MTRPHREIPSQRLALSVTTIAAPTKPQRSVLWALGITLLGWLLLAYPAVLLALLSYILISGSDGSGTSASSVVAGILGMVFVVCMVAAPVLLGLAVMKRLRRFWIPAVITWVLSIAAVIYVIVEWLLPLG